MRITRTLSRYVARETLQYAGVGLLTVLVLLLANNLLRRLEDLIGLGGDAGDLGAVVLRMLVILLPYALPIALLFGTLVALARLGSDHELLAFRSLGMSLAQLAGPALALALAATAATGWLLQRGEPMARRSVRSLLGEIAARGGVLRPGTFTKLDRPGDRMVFVDGRDDAGVLRGILLSDRSDPKRSFTALAASGTFSFDPATATGHLILSDGDVHFDPDPPDSDRTQRIHFERFDYAFDMSDVVGDGPEHVRPRDMFAEELAAALAYFDAHGSAPPGAKEPKREKYEEQVARRSALAFSPLAFVLLAVPLGMGLRRGARSFGALICVSVAFGYYVLGDAASAYARAGDLSIATALWLPNAACGLLALPLWWRARRAQEA